MQVWSVRIERRRIRHQRMIAGSEADARRAAALVLPGTSRANMTFGGIRSRATIIPASEVSA